MISTSSASRLRQKSTKNTGTPRKLNTKRIMKLIAIRTIITNTKQWPTLATVASFIESVSTSVRVAFDEQIDTPIFTVVDSETSEVIRQIPSEDLVAIARFLETHDVDPVGSKALAGVLISAEG